MKSDAEIRASSLYALFAEIDRLYVGRVKYLVLAVNAMNRWGTRRIAALVLLFMMVTAVGISAWYFVLREREDSSGKFLFIELRTIVEVQVLQGNWGRLIDFPSYRYDVSTGKITYSARPFDLDKLLAVYGSFLTYRPAAGTSSSYPIGGISSCLYPIYSTPSKTCDSTSSIGSIDKDGTAHIIYNTKEIVLSLKQQWRTENETIESSEKAVVKFKQTTTIENLGFWKKTNISSMSASPSATSSAHLVIVEDRNRSNVMKNHVDVSRYLAIESVRGSRSSY
jgi:hypothetical protein